MRALTNVTQNETDGINNGGKTSFPQGFLRRSSHIVADHGKIRSQIFGVLAGQKLAQ
jgi:hypothetical protein